MNSEALLKSPLILIIIGILLMVVDGTHYGINVGNFGFIVTIVGIFLYFTGAGR